MESVLEVNANNWEQEVLQPDTLTVVDFWHDHCPWCIRLNPIFEAVVEEYKGKVKFAKLNNYLRVGNDPISTNTP